MTHILETVQMTDKEWKALLYFLDQLSEHQANAGCNDLPKELENMFTKEEGNTMAKEYAIYNNPNAPEGPDWPLPDSCLLSYLSNKIQKQIS